MPAYLPHLAWHRQVRTRVIGHLSYYAITDNLNVVFNLYSQELSYSPLFSLAMGILNALGNTAENILAGKKLLMPEKNC